MLTFYRHSVPRSSHLHELLTLWFSAGRKRELSTLGGVIAILCCLLQSSTFVLRKAPPSLAGGGAHPCIGQSRGASYRPERTETA